MGRNLTFTDGAAIMNLLVKQATGRSDISITDTSSFVSAGELVLSTGAENTLNSLAIVLGRTFMAVRPYTAKLLILNAINTNMYTDRVRKISFYDRDVTPAGFANTDLYKNLASGFDNGSNGGQSVASMWQQNAPIPLEINFAGSSVWDDCHTVYKDVLKKAFRSVDEFNVFVSGIMTQKANDHERVKEAWNRLNLLNRIAGQYNLSQVAGFDSCAVNLTAAYNAEFGTAYTSQELRTVYLDSFMKFYVAHLQGIIKKMEESSVLYHWTPARDDGLQLTRHTPRNKQRLIMYEPLIRKAMTYVMPTIFNTNYLDIKNYEGVEYWQSITSPESIKVTPAQIDFVGDTGLQVVGNTVNLPYVVGFLFDADTLMTDFQMESAETTPIEARKKYYNIWWQFAKNAINDFTENAVLFYMAD